MAEQQFASVIDFTLLFASLAVSPRHSRCTSKEPCETKPWRNSTIFHYRFKQTIHFVGMWNEESLCPYESETTKQLDTQIYRKTERHDLQVRTHSCESCFPVNPVIRNSNQEQSRIILDVRNRM